jgi:hypothetical protein
MGRVLPQRGEMHRWKTGGVSGLLMTKPCAKVSGISTGKYHARGQQKGTGMGQGEAKAAQP